MTAPPRLFDRDLHRRRLDRAARGVGTAEFLRAAVAEDLVGRLEAVSRRFPVAVELGARRGAFGRALGISDAAAKVDFLVQADLSEAMLTGRAGARTVVDEERLPFKEAGVDLIVSAVALHWTNDLVGALIQIRRALKSDGLFLASLLGGATLTELRQALLDAEIEITGGAGPRVSPFAEAGDMGGLLQRAGFALPVVDVDRLTVRYDHPQALIADLRAMGETSVLVERPAARLTRAILARAGEIYIQRFAKAGRIAATFEMITLTGWAPHPAQPRPLKPGSARMRLADALGGIERPAGERAKP
ncbi:MAG: methyltransferase domain-containing protein [Caulobacteraceae bacterium]